MLQVVEQIAQTIVQVNLSKIRRIALTPKTIETILVNNGESLGIDVRLNFHEKGEQGFPREVRMSLSTPYKTSKEEIRELYNKYSQKLREGKYTLYIATDGRLQIEWN